MNHKQEVIEVFRELAIWDIQAEGYPNLEEFYDRIAPLMQREFPEKAVRKILYDYGRASIDRWAGNEETLPPCGDYFDNFKRLLEGRPAKAIGGTITGRAKGKDTWGPPDIAVREGDSTYELGSHPCPKCGFPLNAWDKDCLACNPEGDNILEQAEEEVDGMILGQDKPRAAGDSTGKDRGYDETVKAASVQDKPKGSKLEGLHVDAIGNWAKGTCRTCGGWGYRTLDEPQAIIKVKCPDCKGTGECQHKKIGWVTIDGKRTGLPKCSGCGKSVEQRSRERREEKAATAWLYDPPNDPAMIYADGNWYIDRRTLPERREAGSG